MSIRPTLLYKRGTKNHRLLFHKVITCKTLIYHRPLSLPYDFFSLSYNYDQDIYNHHVCMHYIYLLPVITLFTKRSFIIFSPSKGNTVDARLLLSWRQTASHEHFFFLNPNLFFNIYIYVENRSRNRGR